MAYKKYVGNTGQYVIVNDPVAARRETANTPSPNEKALSVQKTSSNSSSNSNSNSNNNSSNNSNGNRNNSNGNRNNSNGNRSNSNGNRNNSNGNRSNSNGNRSNSNDSRSNQNSSLRTNSQSNQRSNTKSISPLKNQTLLGGLVPPKLLGDLSKIFGGKEDGAGGLFKSFGPNGLETEDILLAAILYLLYLESEDTELLIMLGAFLFL